METAARVLLLGYDEGLQETRAAVLRHFWPVSMTRPGQHPELLSRADLVVLCSTIPEDERQHWIDTVRHEHPHLLIVKMNGFDAGPRMGADATVGMGGGPGALVSTIYGLVTEKGLASRPWASRETTLLDEADESILQ